MNATNPLGPAGPTTLDRPRRKASAAQARAALTRERASAIFGGPETPVPILAAPVPAPAPPPEPPPPPASRPLVPPEPSSGRLDGLRTWLLLRCGLEFRTVLALAVVLLVGAGLAVQHYVSGRPHVVRVPPPVPAAAAPPPSASSKPDLTVDIAGRVAHPGVRQLPAGSRVEDALSAAGGSLPGTDTTALNLARPLADGEQLLVGLAPPPGAATSSATDPPQGTPLSLNSATAPQLDALPGVGPVLAQHILDFRTQHGGFTTLQQLRQVPGIGDHKFTTLKALVHP